MKKKIFFIISAVSIMQSVAGQVVQVKDSAIQYKLYQTFLEVISCHMDTSQLAYFRELKKIGLTNVKYGFANPDYEEKLFTNLVENPIFKPYLKFAVSDSSNANCQREKKWKITFYNEVNNNLKAKCNLLLYPLIKANNRYYAYASMTSQGYFDDMFGVTYIAIFNSSMEAIHLSPLEVYY
jgi:hypothetical protein